VLANRLRKGRMTAGVASAAVAALRDGARTG
jgi:hypothetical protein